MKVGLIVEGHGEVEALPILMRRILQELAPERPLPAILSPHRMKRSQIVKEQDFKNAIEFMARKVGDRGRILVLFDADDDLPCVLGPKLQDWAREQRPDKKVKVAIAKHEYEAWFLAAAVSLRGRRGLPMDLTPHHSPETLRNAKGWLAERMPNGYKETLDQAPLTSCFDLMQARRAHSFNKLLFKVGNLFDLPVPPREESSGT